MSSATSTASVLQIAALDAFGRLLRLEVRPWLATPATAAVDRAALFAAAGLDRGRFAPAGPAMIPPTSSDARLAWTGTYADGPWMDDELLALARGQTRVSSAS